MNHTEFHCVKPMRHRLTDHEKVERDRKSREREREKRGISCKPAAGSLIVAPGTRGPRLIQSNGSELRYRG